jgi:carboxyl-terminal processing protease
MTLKNIRTIVVVLILMVLSAGIGYNFGREQAQNGLKTSLTSLKGLVNIVNREPVNQSVDFSNFWRVWEVLQDKYYDQQKLDPQKMVNGAISGMVASIKDPWTVYLPPEDNQMAKDDLNGEFEGVGIQLGYKDEKLAVIAPLKGLPAEKNGVRAGDLILRIKDSSKNIDLDTSTITIYEAVNYIRGPQGSQVELTLQHENESEPYSVALKRETIKVPSVELSIGRIQDNRWEEIKDNQEPGSDLYAWLKLNRFGDNTLAEWTTAVQKVSDQYQSGRINGLVLDLRNNPGGYLSGAVSLASEFIDKGVIVKQQNNDGTVEDYSVNRKGLLGDIPLTILINKGSASASEILAAAMRIHQRAKLVGQQTFGKGTIQEVVELGDKAGLHVTTAKWLAPDGTWLQDNTGLKPDVEVENPKEDDTIDLQLNKAIEELP